jgi:hypothetical protein
MASEIKASLALTPMSCIAASQECMEKNANETDSTVAKLFYRYVGLTLTAMEGVDKAACFAAEAVYDTPGTGSMMAWGMRALELVALSTVFSLSVSIAVTIITTAIVFAIVFGVIAGLVASGGGSIGFFLQGMRDMFLSSPEETEMDEKEAISEVVSEDGGNQRMSDMLLEMGPSTLASSDQQEFGQQDDSRRHSPVGDPSSPWFGYQPPKPQPALPPRQPVQMVLDREFMGAW